MSDLRIDRRRFLRRAVGRDVVVRLSCEELYIRYRAAADAGRIASFVRGVTREVGGAEIVELTDCEWLADEGLREALAEVPGLARSLPPCGALQRAGFDASALP